ncbi:shieldin complex subunit 1 isoform X2 [Tamandua tetradactyla]|uniref:shieldin complex subunit 1 isoform X2 n=1 Tax=Tamandua tetradactyla TaxID=48850 RepID=UPI00405393AA
MVLAVIRLIMTTEEDSRGSRIQDLPGPLLFLSEADRTGYTVKSPPVREPNPHRTMAAPGDTPDSQSEESSALALPSADDIRDYVLQKPSQEASSEAFSSVEVFSFPCSSDVDPDTSNPDVEQNGSWTSENFWLDPSVKDQPETKEEEDGLRKSLDRFYEAFGRPQLASGNPLSAAVCQCLSQKITELKGWEGQTYALRSFQVARVILSRDGCSVLQEPPRGTSFYPPGEGSASPHDLKPTPGLSKDIIHFLLQQNRVQDP